MSRDEEVITTTAAERRLGGALMWTGVMLGAMFIAVLFLGFMYYNATMSPNSTLTQLNKKNEDLAAKLDTTSQALTTSKQDLKDTKKALADLQVEYDKVAKKKPGAPKPPPVNPF